jgi:sn-glycerol 3-phosphate transport system substrate-binding protein
MKCATLGILAATVLLAGLPSLSVAATEIQFWHAMTGAVGERVSDMVAKFNASQSDYIVNAVHKGSYADTFNAAIAADRAKQQPHIVQVADRGTQRMLSSGAVYPVHQLMKDNAVALDLNDLIGPLRSYYSTSGNLYSMAFNSATPILYNNKDHFKKAGLPDKAPTT